MVDTAQALGRAARAARSARGAIFSIHRYTLLIHVVGIYIELYYFTAFAKNTLQPDQAVTGP